MEINTKVTTTYQMKVSIEEIRYLRDLTQNYLSEYSDDETIEENDIRRNIFKACSNLIAMPTPRR